MAMKGDYAFPETLEQEPHNKIVFLLDSQIEARMNWQTYVKRMVNRDHGLEDVIFVIE